MKAAERAAIIARARRLIEIDDHAKVVDRRTTGGVPDLIVGLPAGKGMLFVRLGPADETWRDYSERAVKSGHWFPCWETPDDINKTLKFLGL